MDKLYEEITTYKQAMSNLQLENQRTKDKVQSMEESHAAFEKKKKKLKEKAEKSAEKVEKKKKELDSVKAAHSGEIAQLSRSLDDLRNQV
jgi:predicted  nucleic acid-binding Zn-ribbon protein